MINVIQTFFLEEQYIDFEPETRDARKEEARKQLGAMMHRDYKGLSGAPDDQPWVPSGYLEPDENGFYPGLEEAGRLDV